MKIVCNLLRITSGGSIVECCAFQCGQCPKNKDVGIVTPRCFKIKACKQTDAEIIRGK